MGILRRFNVRVPVRDGSFLSADLALPAPAVITRTPYGKSGELHAKRAAVFAGGGCAYVSLDVRGRGDSDGIFEPYRHDGADGADVIAWAAAQHQCCAGDVATYGASYGGTTRRSALRPTSRP
jgi:putative CocE/NonD family hydrolase